MYLMTSRTDRGPETIDINCLQPVNYDRLFLNKKRLAAQQGEDISVYHAASLEVLSARKLCHLGEKYCGHAISTAPGHLAPVLLREAFVDVEPTAIVPMIANWPLEELCFRDILPPSKLSIFEEEMFVDLLVFKGVAGRKKKCRLLAMDLRGLELNPTFIKLVIQMWPILSLKKKHRNIKKLTEMVLEEADLKKDNRLAQEIIPKIIKDMLSHERALPLHDKYSITIPQGKKMIVKVDKLEFTTQTTFFMDYLITHCLRRITPLHVQVSNVLIRSDLNLGDEILDSLAPFIVFRGHAVETLKGIWLGNLEDNVFFIVHKDLAPYTNIQALGIPNCNIALQEGRTRIRTRTRNQLTSTLTGFPYLNRLDLTQNTFAGCLEEILDSLHLPLEYLNLKDCDLFDVDMEYLAHSKHAKSLKYLNVSRICGLFPDDDFAVTSTCLVNNLKYFTNVCIIQLQQNQIGDSKCKDICETISKHWKSIKGINFADNVFTQESCFKIARAASKVKSLQMMKLPHTHNLLDQNSQLEQNRNEFVGKLQEILKGCQRPDIEVEVLSLAYAIIGNW